MRQLPNMITLLRIPLSIATLVVPPFSVLFWMFYLSSGATDLMDGFLARRLHLESSFGARLDSIADLVFAGSLTVFVLRNIRIPPWLWLCALAIALLRFVSYGIGCYKYHDLAGLHTWANRCTGILIFIAPLLYRLFGLPFTGMLLCIVAFVSACEELVILMRSKKLDRDHKGLLIR